jgi:hypothetical protein
MPEDLVSVSRYVSCNNVKVYSKSIRETPEWYLVKDDPIFAVIKVDGATISLKDLTTNRVWQQAPSSPGPTTIDAERLQGSTRKRHRSEDCGDEHHWDSEDHASRPPDKDCAAARDNDAGHPETQESGVIDSHGDRLAPLGTSKFVQAAMLPDDGNLSNTGLDMTVDGTRRHSGTTDSHQRTYRKDSGYGSARGSYSNGSGGSGYDKTYNGNSTHSASRFRVSLDGSNDSPSPPSSSTDYFSRMSASSPGRASESSNTHHRRCSSSPSHPSVEVEGKGRDHRFDAKESSNNQQNRQVDDLNSKVRKRQVQVADAYR